MKHKNFPETCVKTLSCKFGGLNILFKHHTRQQCKVQVPKFVIGVKSKRFLCADFPEMSTFDK